MEFQARPKNEQPKTEPNAESKTESKQEPKKEQPAQNLMSCPRYIAELNARYYRDKPKPAERGPIDIGREWWAPIFEEEKALEGTPSKLTPALKLTSSLKLTSTSPSTSTSNSTPTSTPISTSISTPASTSTPILTPTSTPTSLPGQHQSQPGRRAEIPLPKESSSQSQSQSQFQTTYTSPTQPQTQSHTAPGPSPAQRRVSFSTPTWNIHVTAPKDYPGALSVVVEPEQVDITIGGLSSSSSSSGITRTTHYPQM